MNIPNCNIPNCHDTPPPEEFFCSHHYTLLPHKLKKLLWAQQDVNTVKQCVGVIQQIDAGRKAKAATNA